MITSVLFLFHVFSASELFFVYNKEMSKFKSGVLLTILKYSLEAIEADEFRNEIKEAIQHADYSTSILKMKSSNTVTSPTPLDIFDVILPDHHTVYADYIKQFYVNCNESISTALESGYLCSSEVINLGDCLQEIGRTLKTLFPAVFDQENKFLEALQTNFIHFKPCTHSKRIGLHLASSNLRSSVILLVCHLLALEEGLISGNNYELNKDCFFIFLKNFIPELNHLILKYKHYSIRNNNKLFEHANRMLDTACVDHEKLVSHYFSKIGKEYLNICENTSNPSYYLYNYFQFIINLFLCRFVCNKNDLCDFRSNILTKAIEEELILKNADDSTRINYFLTLKLFLRALCCLKARVNVEKAREYMCVVVVNFCITLVQQYLVMPGTYAYVNLVESVRSNNLPIIRPSYRKAVVVK